MNSNGNVSNASSSKTSSRVLQKLQTALDSGSFYEAHQTYRTLYFRFSSQPAKHEELLQLLYDGSTRLLDLGQVTSGCDLALLFVEFLHKTSRPVDERVLDKIEGIFERFIRPSTRSGSGKANSAPLDVSSDRDLFVSNLIKWTKLVSPKHKFGHPSLHSRLAHCWWSVGNYQQARYHFMLSDDGEGCAAFLIKYHVTKGYPSEADLFVTQAVLQFLCRKDKLMADAVFMKYILGHPSFSGRRVISSTVSKHAVNVDPDGPPYQYPLLNFVWLLLLCVDTGRLTDFTILVEKYQPSIKRDPSYTDYLDRIGQLYFGLPPPKKAASGGLGGSFLRNLMSGLLSDENENNDEETEEAFESVPGSPTQSLGSPSQPSTRSKLMDDDALD